ncbi:MAG: archaetidylserine decarboxylase [Steroidobacteraceae bacterium]
MIAIRAAVGRLLQIPRVNFVITNRLPRRQLTLFMAWFSKIEQPLVRSVSIALWKFFADVDLSDARQQRFSSLHECFIRELQQGARPVDERVDVLTSPCDALVGARGTVRNGLVLQAKGRPYTVAELLGDPLLAHHYEGGSYITLRLTAGMYHRFHAPADCRIEQVGYVPGDTWNVNPATLQRLDRVYCRNERAIIRCRTGQDELLTLVPVAAILVASIRLHCLDTRLHLRYQGPQQFLPDRAVRKGQELGWFEHGSTLVMFVPRGFALAGALVEGPALRMGEPLFQRLTQERAGPS